jgi:hypothetical protein
MKRDENLSLEEQVAKIRAKRNGGEWKDRARRILNNVFLVVAGCGVATYFLSDDKMNGIILVGIGMAFKAVEIIIRILR